MRLLSKCLLAAGAASLVVACAQQQEKSPPVTQADPAAETVVTETIVEEVRPAPIGSATVSVGLNKDQNNAPYFASAAAGFCEPGGGCAGGIVTGTGNVDLSGFPPGDITVTVALDDDAYNAGYRFPPNPFDAIGIAVWPVGATTEPPGLTPLFGPNAWPRSDFQPPALSGDKRSVTFLDEESAENAYQYAIALDGPGGRIILDPKIQNTGGVPPLPEPVPAEPTPQ